MLGFVVDFATSYYGKLFLVDMGIQWVGWIFATVFKTEKFYDLTGENKGSSLTWGWRFLIWKSISVYNSVIQFKYVMNFTEWIWDCYLVSLCVTESKLQQTGLFWF